MTGLVDIHCHILPGVDDGCRDVADSIELARKMVEAGITDAICTPHIQPAMPHNDLPQIAQGVIALRDALAKAKVPLRLWPGGENRCGPENITLPSENLILASHGRSRGGPLGRQFFLFDNWGKAMPDLLRPMVERLVGEGITPILAHPERTPWMWDDPLGVAEELNGLGVRLQLNAYILAADRPGPRAKIPSVMMRTAHTLLEDGRYDFLATDSHRPHAWPERLEGLEVARDILGEAEVIRLMRDNAQQLLPAQ